jgi:hypothetical protein
MPEHGMVDQGYNYTYFDEHVAAGADADDEAAFRASYRAGEQAGDFALAQLDDGADGSDSAQVKLSDLWRSKPLVMEFGSFT